MFALADSSEDITPDNIQAHRRNLIISKLKLKPYFGEDGLVSESIESSSWLTAA
jgi:hypothetical protein